MWTLHILLATVFVATIETSSTIKNVIRNEKNEKDNDCKDSNPWCRYISEYECKEDSVAKDCQKTCGKCRGKIPTTKIYLDFNYSLSSKNEIAIPYFLITCTDDCLDACEIADCFNPESSSICPNTCSK